MLHDCDMASFLINDTRDPFFPSQHWLGKPRTHDKAQKPSITFSILPFHQANLPGAKGCPALRPPSTAHACPLT
jgi:hypothetical protein